MWLDCTCRLVPFEIFIQTHPQTLRGHGMSNEYYNDDDDNSGGGSTL